MFKAQGYQVEHFTKAWTEEELLAKIGDYHAIGIRSKTKITEKVIKAATKVHPLFLLSAPCSLSKASLTVQLTLYLPFFVVAPAARHRLLLHRNQPGFPPRRRLSRDRRLQLALLQLKVRRRACPRRGRLPLEAAHRPGERDAGGRLEQGLEGLLGDPRKDPRYRRLRTHWNPAQCAG